MIHGPHPQGWIGEIKFFIEGVLYHFVGHVTWIFFNNFQGVEIQQYNNGWTHVRTFEFSKMYLIQLK